MAKNVRYDPSDSRTQVLLSLALFEAWNGKCHWCKRAIADATFQEIDHIIPRSRYDEIRSQFHSADRKVYRKKHLAQRRNLPTDRDSVFNLAPICAAGRRCNQEKLNAIDENTLGAIRDSLKKAMKRSVRVTNRVNQMQAARGLERNLVGLVSLPNTKTTQRLIRKYGPLVLASLWNTNKETFDLFRAPAEVPLRVGLGDVPDFFSEATRTGSGVDGLLHLNDTERVALSSAQILFQVDAIEILADGISGAIERLDNDVASRLDQVPFAGIEGPRWLSITGHEFIAGEQPQFQVELSMRATFGGDAIVGTDQDGQPRHRHRSISVECSITCWVSLLDGEVDDDVTISVIEEE